MKLISIYITCPDEAIATTISQTLIDEKLIACSNVFPVKSHYVWERQMQNDDEWVIVGKSLSSCWNRIETRVTELHPYDVPCIIKYHVEANDPYFEWVINELK